MVTSTLVDETVGLEPNEAIEAIRHDVDPIDRQQRRAALFSSLFDEAPPSLTIDRFVVLEPLGAGAMGRVYRARDPRLEREVAIKLMRRELFEMGTFGHHQARMIDEARALAQLDHPNVVSIYEAGEVDDGVFIAMQYVEGPTLREWMDDGPRSWEEIVRVFRGAAQGLAAAHARGLVHRDFKPANVFISKEDDQVLVGDFGLARDAYVPATEGGARSAATDPNASQHPTQHPTWTGTIMGTPAYMSPEQRWGRPLDGRSDQYSFGISLHEALYGHRPDQGPPPCKRSIPRWLSRVVERTLAGEPDDRFEDMTAVIDALGRDRKAILRRRVAAGGLALALGASALAVVGLDREAAPVDPCAVEQERIDEVLTEPAREGLRAALLASNAPYGQTSAQTVERTLSAYAEHWTQSRRESCEATWVRHEQSSALFDRRAHCLDQRVTAVQALLAGVARSKPVNVRRVVGTVLRLPPIDHCNDRERLLAQAPLPDDPAAARQVEQLHHRLIIARTNTYLGYLDDAEEQTEQVIRGAETLEYPPLLAVALGLSAVQAKNRWDLPRAEQILERALFESQAAGSDHTTIRLIGLLTFVVGNLQERFDEGQRWLSQGRAVLRRVGDAPDLEAILLTEEGNLRIAQGRDREAREAYEAALALHIEAYGTEHPNTIGAHNNLGLIAYQREEYQQAIDHYDEALAGWTALYGNEHPDVAATLYGRAGALVQLDRLDEAEADSRRSYAIYEAAVGPEHIDTADVLCQSGNIYFVRREYDQARRKMQRCLEIYETKLGPEHSATLNTVSTIGRTFQEQGDCDTAMTYFDRSLTAQHEHLGKQHPDLLRNLDAMVWCQLEQGHPQAALASAESGLELRKELYGPEHQSLRLSLERQGHAHLALGDESGALASFEAALAFDEGTDSSSRLEPSTRFEAARLLLANDPHRARTLAKQAEQRWQERDQLDKAAEVTAWVQRSFPNH